MPENPRRLPWSIAPLRSKYYGTEIVDCDGTHVCMLWSHEVGTISSNTPSTREMEKHGPFESDAAFLTFWNDYCCDTHYECERDFAHAELIIATVNATAA